jgi:hypothetical protein
MSQTLSPSLAREGRANVFVAVEHANSEVVGIHASRSANRFEALEPVRQGVPADTAAPVEVVFASVMPPRSVEAVCGTFHLRAIKKRRDHQPQVV